MKPDRYILEKFFMNEALPHETDSIYEWLESDPNNEKIFQEAHQRFVMDTLVLAEMSDKALNTEGARKSSGRTWKWIATAAASLLIGFMVNNYFVSMPLKRKASETMTVSAPAGQRVDVMLADGSKVFLNSGSTLEYPVIFREDTRCVKLEGEAMFDVAYDEDKPFKVETFAYGVKVLGTRFNVVADKVRGEFSTSLLEGCVAITGLSEDREYIMRPNTMVSLKSGRLVVQEIMNMDAYLWTEGILSVSDMDFIQVVEKLEKTYAVDIEITCDTLPQIGFRRLKFRISDGIEHALEVLRINSDFEFETDPETGVITIFNN